MYQNSVNQLNGPMSTCPSTWIVPNNGVPITTQAKCNPCNADPLYNPPNPCGTGAGIVTKCGPCGSSKSIATCSPCGLPTPGCIKDLCPLKSFCDPGLAYGCKSRPIVDPFAPQRSVTTWKN